ncbi:NUDIX domain-containing protein [Myceligenerans crystallogenes]|uniref:NUDIX domain-containing protein n=1 Tax=Myceligenerans crystallogenes TaxID=316335 RepID=A0ABP4ZK66_9MICO
MSSILSRGTADGAADGAATLRIVAAIVIGTDGRHLLVRKRGTTSFIQVGGKIEPGEAPLAAMVREAEEEVGLRFSPERVEVLGRFDAPAANEPGHVVDAHAFLVRLLPGETPRAQAELEELVWIDPDVPAVSPGTTPSRQFSIAPLSLDLLAAWAARR